ncbi:mechanosensitive ion channel family protein [Jeongeupia chitinilytica]|uniref:Small-conductance mechanosensitive channel n=1 Tax=Jeongeupia chitinilytica TaxID=1041641 RepID=A0ABQ3GXH1_9NEIS|nr:mechanosensitive ion channel family protein [Jeongeupia chitinilytica]GHD57163.1 mechanosensitive ion channel protein MscS [Jeongeupia chitinilytica]
MRLITLIFLFCLSLLAHAGDASAPASLPPAASGADEVPLVLNNRTIVVFRGNLLGSTPQQRKEAAEKRIRRLVGDATPLKLSVRTNDEGGSLMYDGNPLFFISTADVDTLAGETLHGDLESAKQELTDLFTDMRGFDKPQEWLLAIAKAVVATLVFGLALWLLRRVWQLWSRLVRFVLGRIIQKLNHMRSVVPVRLIKLGLRLLGYLIFWPSALGIAYVWMSFVLRCFPYTRIWGEQLDAAMLALASQFAIAILSALPSLAVVVLILLLTRWFVRGINYLFVQVESGRVQLGFFDADTAATTRKLLSVAAWLFAVAMIYPYLPGANTDAFKGLSVIVGLMVSLGASSVVGQFASGLILIYSRSIKVGEYVQIGDEEGTVMEIGMFATKVHTNLREEVSIPNSVLVSQSVKNFSRLARGGGVICKIVVTIGYDTPWRQVHAMLLEAAKRTPGLRQDPQPVVYQTALSDFYVEYHLRFALDEPRLRLQILSELNGNVQDVFNEYGVQIMSPNYEDDPHTPKLVKPEDFYLAPAKRPDAP